MKSLLKWFAGLGYLAFRICAGTVVVICETVVGTCLLALLGALVGLVVGVLFLVGLVYVPFKVFLEKSATMLRDSLEATNDFMR